MPPLSAYGYAHARTVSHTQTGWAQCAFISHNIGDAVARDPSPHWCWCLPENTSLKSLCLLVCVSACV